MTTPCQLCTSRVAHEDVMRRREAAVREREVSADSVRHNADKKSAEVWRLYQEALYHLEALVMVAAADDGEWDAAFNAARAYLTRPVQPGEPLDGT